MASVNASRRGLAQNVKDATEHARLIGFNSDGEACVWSGGYTFNVYDAARDWHETRAFTSGELAGVSDCATKDAHDLARERMRSEGFLPVEP